MTSTAALAIASPPRMTVHSDLLGPLSASDDDLINFPAGLFGFPECRSFVLVPAGRDGVYWLQSAEHRALTFLLVDPFLFFEAYSVDLTTVDLTDLQTRSASDIAILCIATLPRSRATRPTANLQGPLALNLDRRVAKQLAIPESDFGVRSPFDLATPIGVP